MDTSEALFQPVMKVDEAVPVTTAFVGNSYVDQLLDLPPSHVNGLDVPIVTRHDKLVEHGSQ